MVKYREILRLAAMGISQRNIAHSCGCGQTTVSEVTKAAAARGLAWPLDDDMDDAAIREVLYPPRSRKQNKASIDHVLIAKEMLKRGMTMSLLWHEYCEKSLSCGKEPYMYSAFCSEHRKWAERSDVRMHIEHKPGYEMQVDYVGDTGEVIDPDTGEVHKVYVFAACLPYSNYLFAEGFYTTNEEAWIAAHIHAFDFFGGVTPVLIPDNAKTAVTKNTKDELILNEQYRRMSEYYGCAIVPARPRRPRDKASIEMGVGIIERQAMLALRKRRFMSLADYNRALRMQIDIINTRPFQKREGSRMSVYSDQEKHLLIPLPAHPYEIVTHKESTVSFNYHVSFDGAWYSVPFQYVKRIVQIRATANAISVYLDGTRIAMHERTTRKGAYVTNADHMPKAHRDFVEWTGDRFRKWARKIGPAVEHVVDAILKSKRIEQQAYRSCRALLALSRKYGDELLGEACDKALIYSSRPSYKTVKDLVGALAKQRDEQNDDEGAFLRGNDYYHDLEDDNSTNAEEDE